MSANVLMSARQACVLSVLLVLAALPAAAAAKPSDYAPTRTYVQADYALSRSARSHLPTAESTIRGFIGRVERECPKVAVGSPQNLEAEQLYEEALAAVTGIVYHSDAAAIARFAQTVAALHWSNPTLTRVAHSYAARLKALSTMAMPPVCADVKAWAASGYRTLTASTTVAVQRLRTIEDGAAEVPPGLLAPYERPRESRILEDTRLLEVQLQEAEATRGTGYLSKIVATLGLDP
jgi:hypothetical protein